jgi:hypothetical protein
MSTDILFSIPWSKLVQNKLLIQKYYCSDFAGFKGPQLPYIQIASREFSEQKPLDHRHRSHSGYMAMALHA